MSTKGTRGGCFPAGSGHLQTVTFTAAFGCIVYIRTYTTKGIDLLSIPRNALSPEHAATWFPVFLSLSPPLLHQQSPVTSAYVTGFLYHPLSPKSYYVLKITRRAASAPNEMTFEVDIPQNHIPIAVITQHLFVQSIFLTTCRAWSGKIWFHYLYFRHTSPISWQFIHSLRAANSYEFVGMTLT